MLICLDFSSHFPTWAREKWFWAVFFHMSKEILIIFSGKSHGKLHLSKAYFQASLLFTFVLINITWAFCFKSTWEILVCQSLGQNFPAYIWNENLTLLISKDLTNAKALNETWTQKLLPYNHFLTANLRGFSLSVGCTA